jgi:hypothetical protein
VVSNAKGAAMGMQCTCVPDGMHASCDPEHGLGAYVLWGVVLYCMARAAAGLVSELSDESDDGEECSTMYS